MKTYMKRYIMAALLLAAGIGGASAKVFFVGSNNPTTFNGNRVQDNQKYATLEALINATNWERNNNIYITSDLTVTEQAYITHNCTIQPYGGSFTISADIPNFNDKNRTILMIHEGTVTLTNNGNYTLTIEGFGWNLGQEGCYVDIRPVDQQKWDQDNNVKFAGCVTVQSGVTFKFNAGTLTNGYQYEGGGIKVEPGGTAEMSGSAIITKCSARQGGGVYNRGTFTLAGEARITKNLAWVDNRQKIENNKDKGCTQSDFENLYVALGGGICNEKVEQADQAMLYITGGEISENEIYDPLDNRKNEYHDKMKDKDGHAYPNLSPAGAGVSIYGGTAQMTGGRITNNKINLPESYDTDDKHANGGGGVQVTSFRNKTEKDADYADWMKGTFSMSAGTISNNGARRGGGFILGGQSETTITGGKITENWAQQQGGGIFLNKQYALFNADGVEFTKNECRNGGGGAIYVNESDPRTIVKNSTFKDNKCRYSGGAIILEHSGSTDNAYMHLQDITFDGNYSDKIGEDDAKNNSSNNGNAISNKGKLYISGTFTLKNTNGHKFNQDWGLRKDSGEDYIHEHVIFKEGEVTFLDGDGKPIKLGIHVIEPSDRRNIFVSTVKSDVVAGDRQLFKVKTTDWVGTEYFNSREVAAGLGDIDKNYNADQMYSGWNESRNSTRKVAPKAQPTPVIELHKLGQITITNEALSHGESAVYTVKPKADAVGNALRSEYKVVLQGTDDKDPATVSRTIIDVEPGDYYVIEETWNWAYENADKEKAPAWVSAGETTTFSFTGTRQSPATKQVMYDEDIKENLFKQTR